MFGWASEWVKKTWVICSLTVANAQPVWNKLHQLFASYGPVDGDKVIFWVRFLVIFLRFLMFFNVFLSRWVRIKAWIHPGQVVISIQAKFSNQNVRSEPFLPFFWQKNKVGVKFWVDYQTLKFRNSWTVGPTVSNQLVQFSEWPFFHPRYLKYIC